MTGNVFLRTDQFEVKLEGITFKRQDFEYLCTIDFLFPKGRVWDRPPVVGLDVMRHPRDPSVLLVLLCFGVGCVILRFVAGEALPAPIHRFLADERIRFVGFGIPEKKDLFPFKELGLSKNKVDVGYLAARVLKQPKCKTWELADLARRVVGIKSMVGMTEASSFERHERIKCAICQLFITTVIATGLMRKNVGKKKAPDSGPHKKSSFLKKLDGSLHTLAEGWFKLPKGKKKDENKKQAEEEEDSIHVHIGNIEDMFGSKDFLGSDSPFSNSIIQEDSSPDQDYGEEVIDFENDDEGNRGITRKMPLKGILKCPSKHLLNSNTPPSEPISPSAQKEMLGARGSLRRANSKGFNVSFKDL